MQETYKNQTQKLTSTITPNQSSREVKKSKVALSFRSTAPQMRGAKEDKKGFLLISSLIILTTMIVIVSFYLTETMQEVRMSKIVDTALQTYYLSEAGIQEAFWRLQNVQEFKNNFETDPNWTTTFTRNDSIIPNGSYTVTIANTDLARAAITSTSTILVHGTQTQRIVKTVAFKAMGGPGPLDTVGVYSYLTIKTQSSNNIVINNGGLHSNDNITTNAGTNLTVHGVISSVGNNNLTAGNIIADETRDKHSIPPPEPIEMPSVSFDDPSDPDSLKNQAVQIYTESQFANNVLNQSTINLTGIHYVTGDIAISGTKNITITNGALVSDGDININGEINLTITQEDTSIPSGLIAKNNINFLGAEVINIQGIIYGNNTCTIKNENLYMTIDGAIICMNTNLKGCGYLEINTNPQRTQAILGNNAFSPVIYVEHWEEEY